MLHALRSHYLHLIGTGDEAGAYGRYMPNSAARFDSAEVHAHEGGVGGRGEPSCLNLVVWTNLRPQTFPLLVLLEYAQPIRVFLKSRRHRHLRIVFLVHRTPWRAMVIAHLSFLFISKILSK